VYGNIVFSLLLMSCLNPSLKKMVLYPIYVFGVALKFKMPALVVHSLTKERIGGKRFL
jgi:hypothetical protein